MKYIVRFATVTLMLLCCISHDANAQFWNIFKKKKRMVEQRDKQDSRRDDRSDNIATDIPEPEKVYYPQSVKKDRYRVDLLASFHLDELVVDGKVVHKTSMPAKVLPSVLFYEGMMVAADSLKKLGYKLDIYVHDITDELESVQTLINTDELSSSDLIIGLVSSKYFPRVAKYANKHNINFISALSPSDDDVGHNPFFTMLQPTLQTHCDVLSNRMLDKYGKASRIMLYRDNIPVDNVASEYLMLDESVAYKKLNCNSLPAKEQLGPLLDENEANVILMPIISDEYASEILKKIYEWFPEMNFEVWGMPSWTDMKDLKKPEAFPNIAVYYTSPYYFDATTASGQAFVKKYQKQFGTSKPDYMAFRGYETLFWYAYLLQKYGTIFNQFVIDTGMAPFTRYDIRMTYDADDKPMYNENQHLYLYRYQGSSYIVSQ